MQGLELEAMRLGVVAINLGGADGGIKGFYTRMGYTGRGSMMSRRLLPSPFAWARVQKLSDY